MVSLRNGWEDSRAGESFRKENYGCANVSAVMEHCPKMSCGDLKSTSHSLWKSYVDSAATKEDLEAAKLALDYLSSCSDSDSLPVELLAEVVLDYEPHVVQGKLRSSPHELFTRIESVKQIGYYCFF